MSRTVTRTPTDDEHAALTSATAPAQIDSAASTAASKTTQELLAEHGPEIDAEIARRRSSMWPGNGGSP